MRWVHDAHLPKGRVTVMYVLAQSEEWRVTSFKQAGIDLDAQHKKDPNSFDMGTIPD